MICSNKRKLTLCGWLKNNNGLEYCSSLKLQKFLLWYELFSDVDGEQADFDRLCGYKHGPVFSTVFGDYTHERSNFDCAAQLSYEANKEMVNKDRAKRSSFIVSILTEDELSELSHKLNFWKAKYPLIRYGIRNVELDESDFNDDDKDIVRTFESMYPMSLIENSAIVSIGEKYFLLEKEDRAKLSDQNIATLVMLSGRGDLVNPVYVSLDEEGRLVID